MNGKEAVWEKVETFRKHYLRGDLAHLPVEMCIRDSGGGDRALPAEILSCGLGSAT